MGPICGVRLADGNPPVIGPSLLKISNARRTLVRLYYAKSEGSDQRHEPLGPDDEASRMLSTVEKVEP